MGRITVNIPLGGRRRRARAFSEAEAELKRAQTRKTLGEARSLRQKTDKAEAEQKKRGFAEFLKAARDGGPNNPRALSLMQRAKGRGGWNEDSYLRFGFGPKKELFFIDAFGNPAVSERPAGSYVDPETGRKVVQRAPILDANNQKIPVTISARQQEEILRGAAPEVLTTLSPGQTLTAYSRTLGGQARQIASGRPRITTAPAGSRIFSEGKEIGNVPAKLAAGESPVKSAKAALARIMRDPVGSGIDPDLQNTYINAFRFIDEAAAENPTAGSGVLLERALDKSGYLKLLKEGRVETPQPTANDPGWLQRLWAALFGNKAVAAEGSAASPRSRDVRAAEEYLRGSRQGGHVRKGYRHEGIVMAAHGGVNEFDNAGVFSNQAPQAPAAPTPQPPAPGFTPALRASTGSPYRRTTLRPSGGRPARPRGFGLNTAAAASGNPVLARLQQLGFADPSAVIGRNAGFFARPAMTPVAGQLLDNRQLLDGLRPIGEAPPPTGAAGYYGPLVNQLLDNRQLLDGTAPPVQGFGLNVAPPPTGASRYYQQLLGAFSPIGTAPRPPAPGQPQLTSNLQNLVRTRDRIRGNL